MKEIAVILGIMLCVGIAGCFGEPLEFKGVTDSDTGSDTGSETGDDSEELPEICEDLDEDGFSGHGSLCQPESADFDCDESKNSVNPGAPEKCNNVDDDCDGLIDEDLTQECYTGTEGTLGMGSCVGGTQTCEAGEWGSCEGEQIPSLELCDEEDHDCNGDRTNGFNVNDDCSLGVGACESQGVFVCNDEGTGVECDALAGESEDEDCDGLDNDCDGVSDEDEDGDPLIQECYSGPEDTLDVGLCESGTQICTDGEFETCDGEVIPVNESDNENCDGVDNDCDGEVDEECECVYDANDPASQDCYTGPEGTSDVGECHMGVQLCEETDRWGPCEDEVIPVNESDNENCDSVDNDCDGEVDEECECVYDANDPASQCYTGPEGTVNIGICMAGLKFCYEDDRFGECEDQVLPEPETCSNMGVDDDCDEQVDNVPHIGTECNTGEAGVCNPGELRCISDEPELVCVRVTEPQPETCANPDEDDDCNGIEDDVEGLRDNCNTGEQGICAAGIQICAELELRCVRIATQGPETCANMGADNNCDGERDNIVNLGRGCNTEFQGTCRPGSLSCVNNALACTPYVFPTSETCDNLGADDNCNGIIDDCLTELEGRCSRGRWSCDPEEICEPMNTPVDETCSNTGADDNCDGLVDNVEGVGDFCIFDPGIGFCARGAGVCEDSVLECEITHPYTQVSCN